MFGSLHDVLTLDRLAFLKKVLAGHPLSASAVQDLLVGHRLSTRRQYESGWKKFQKYVAATGCGSVSPQVPLDFASHLFHGRAKIAAATVVNAMVAIRDPLWFGFGLAVEPRQWELMRASFFLQRPPARQVPPSWSLEKVLRLLESPRFVVEPSAEDLLLKALFLVAMATGHRVSQLAALLRTPEFTKFGVGLSSATLVPRPGFLAKNERRGHRVLPVTFPAWVVDGAHHPLCPVAALDAYIAATSRSQVSPLWVQPGTLRPLRTADIAKKLVLLVKTADPSSRPKAHQVRKYASTLAFFRSFDVEKVRRAGQWASSRSFVSRYLLPHLRDVPCIALGVRPGASSVHLD